MAGLRYLLGYNCKSPGYNTKALKTAESKGQGDSSHKKRNLEAGTPVVGEVNPIM